MRGRDDAFHGSFLLDRGPSHLQSLHEAEEVVPWPPTEDIH